MHAARCLWIAILSITTSIAHAPGQDDVPIDAKTLRARDGTEVDVRYGRLEVPENRSKKNARTISLAWMWVKSPLAKPGTPVFPLAGGPGGAAIEMTERWVRGGGRRFLEMMGGDIIAIDQRGVGRSTPNLETPTRFGFDVEKAGDPARDLARMQRVCREEAARWRTRGVDLAGYNTRESADDLDAVRRALGLAKISLWAQSYGTHLALATIRRHGKHIDRAVLIGPEGPDHTIKLPSYAQRGLEKIGTLVANHPRLGPAIPDVLHLVETVLERFDDGPIAVAVGPRTIGISKSDVQRYLADAIGTSPREIARVPATLMQMKRGDFTALAKTLATQRRAAGVHSAMQMVMDSASGLTAARAERIARERDRSLLGDAVNGPFPHLREAWGVPDLGDDFRAPVRSDIPVLFIVGDLDSRTPVENARELMKSLPRSHLIIVRNAAHAVRWNAPELARAWSAFLAGREVAIDAVDAPDIRFELLPGMEPIAPDWAVAVAERDLAACVGVYRFANGMTFDVRAEKGRLVAHIEGKGTFNLWPKSALRYVADTRQIPPLEFVKGAAGTIDALRGGSMTARRVR